MKSEYAIWINEDWIVYSVGCLENVVHRMDTRYTRGHLIINF